jgi:hypothetical protein
MTTKINASTAGLTETVDTSGILELQTANTSAVIIDATQNANFVSTGAITVPVGTTAQRPTATNGMIRYNTTTSAFEYYANGTWATANVTPPPTNTVAPVVSGSTTVGGNATVTTGTWNYSPTGYYYQWYANTSAISNATANVFTITSSQNGANLYCNVTAYNVAGNSAPAKSNVVGPVTSTYTMTYFIAAGGGGGSNGGGSGGGGAGGVAASSATVTPGTVYTMTVGGGGGGSSSGSTSSISTINSASGGGGGSYGGSGAQGGSSGNGNAGNSGNPSQGYYGGGGGSGGAAGNRDGGPGTATSITGSSVTYAGGGGGGNSGYDSPGSGAAGGGNGGFYNVSTNPGNGGTNTGSGGGGSSFNAPQGGGSGGSGIVIISVPTASYSGVTSGSPTVTTSGGNTILKYTSSGTYTA